MDSPQRLWGTITWKERWGLSWRGRLVVALLAVLAGWLGFVNIHAFLAVTHRVDARALVVEGWVGDFAIQVGLDEFKSGSYERVYATGGPTEGSGYTSDYDTSAAWGAGRLLRGGIRRELVQMVPARTVGRDRTYASAVALRDWFRDHHLPVEAVNVVTDGPHARRTRLLFQEALGPDVPVGIIAAQSPDYDPQHWWRSSDGVRDVIGESIAYVYARFFFWPDEERDGPSGNVQVTGTKGQVAGHKYP
jgi:uncharacterized SAM-binding protein YcdF (DUF218 family)